MNNHELKQVETPSFGKLMQGELFGCEVRVRTDENGQPWFIAKDVCNILEIVNSRDALNSLDEDEKGVVLTDSLGGPQRTQEVSESGLYHLIFKSRKPVAEAFRKWVTQVVLPAIRRDGFYANGEEGLAAAALRSADYMALRGIEGSASGFGHSTAAACRKLGLDFERRSRRGHRFPVAALDAAASKRKALRGPLCRDMNSAHVYLFNTGEK